jgi:hypothetical protein
MFIFIPPPIEDLSPVILDFSPRQGSIGDEIIIYGQRFSAATAASVNSISVTNFTIDSDTTITATISAGSTTGKVSVTTPTGTGESLADFTVVDPPSVDWGDIGGNLPDQTDLQTELDSKFSLDNILTWQFWL